MLTSAIVDDFVTIEGKANVPVILMPGLFDGGELCEQVYDAVEDMGHLLYVVVQYDDDHHDAEYGPFWRGVHTDDFGNELMSIVLHGVYTNRPNAAVYRILF